MCTSPPETARGQQKPWTPKSTSACSNPNPQDSGDSGGVHPDLRRDGGGALLKAQNAVLLGKTNMDGIRHGLLQRTSCFGGRKTPTARRTSRAAARAASPRQWGRLAAYGLGSDTGGSIRQPAASACGLVGLKPTYGTRLPVRPHRLRLQLLTKAPSPHLTVETRRWCTTCHRPGRRDDSTSRGSVNGQRRPALQRTSRG